MYQQYNSTAGPSDSPHPCRLCLTHECKPWSWRHHYAPAIPGQCEYHSPTARYAPQSARSCRLDITLHLLFFRMMASFRFTARINRIVFGREHILPAPCFRSVRIFDRQRIRQPYIRLAQNGILLMPDPAQCQLNAQRFYQTLRQHGHPVFTALTIAHNNFPAFQLNIFHPQHRTASINRMPVPYNNLIINPRLRHPGCLMQQACISWRVSTTGKRRGFFERSKLSSHGKSTANTSRYKNKVADSA